MYRQDSRINENEAIRALRILESVREKVDSLLKSLNAEKTGHQELREHFEQIWKDIEDVEERAKLGTVRVGILGGRGSGKSTLANALIGEDILPEAAIIFCTNIPTTIKYRHSGYLLEIESGLEDHNYSDSNIVPSEAKRILNLVCNESENPDNIKKISRIMVGVPHQILDGKEIVDVPGFTRGNPLHQAFAERYAKHYCDICLVIISEPDTVQLGEYGGLEALARCFADRLNSTVFIINKCDRSNEKEIEFIKKKFIGYLHVATADSPQPFEPLIYEVSAKNSLNGEGYQYEFQPLLAVCRRESDPSVNTYEVKPLSPEF